MQKVTKIKKLLISNGFFKFWKYQFLVRSYNKKIKPYKIFREILNVGDVVSAIDNIVSGKTNLNTYDCGQVFEAFKDNNLGLIDASIADSILQITTYNTLVYG